MAKARASAPSVNLFPFMSILVCLIGTIVVMICVLSIIQATHMGGRPRSEVELAMKYVADQKKLEEHQKQLDAVQDEITKLNLALEAARQSDETSRELQRQLELAIIQLTALAKEKPPVVDEVEQLRQELAARQIDPQQLVPAVVVQPGGSEVAQGGHLYFVEATGGALTVYKSKSETARVTSGSIGADEEYNAFLEKVAATPGATLVFLIRDDGWWSYQRGAGWAEGSYEIKTAKLPLPGKGTIDLGQFERLMAP
jgi:hypothetical protein